MKGSPSNAFGIQDVCRQILQHLDLPDRLRLISLNRHFWELVSQEIWRRCALVDYRAMMRMPGSEARQGHYTESIRILALDGSFPSLVQYPDAAMIFADLPNLVKVTWKVCSMTKQADGSYDIDAGARYLISIKKQQQKPPPIPDWQWHHSAVKLTYRLTCIIHLLHNMSPESRIARLRATLQPFTHEPISRWEINKHTWTGEELRAVAELLEERHKEMDASPVGCIYLPFHLTHATGLLDPLKRITSLGTKVEVELLPCRRRDQAHCNDTRQAHLYSLIVPYISRTSAWFTVTTAQDGLGGFFPTDDTVEESKDEFPVGLVDEIVYTCYVSRLFVHRRDQERDRILRQTCRPYIPLWTRITRPGSRVLRDHADFLELTKGDPEDALKSSLIAAADRAVKAEVEAAGLRWGILDAPRAI